MDTARIAGRLSPFLETQLTSGQLDQISTYIDLLLRWNARVNLTAIRDPEEVVTRHFGESLFAAQHLFPGVRTLDETSTVAPVSDLATDQRPTTNDSVAADENPSLRLLDIGSGAGFPGLPVKIWSPQTPVTLIESQHKKVAFLREVIRALTLTDIDVFPGRAEDFPPASAGIVTLRAVERFGRVLPIAAARLVPGGTLALLIGSSQIDLAQKLLSNVFWRPPLSIPQSGARILLLASTRQVII